jgi:hypothetical protein
MGEGTAADAYQPAALTEAELTELREHDGVEKPIKFGIPRHAPLQALELLELRVAAAQVAATRCRCAQCEWWLVGLCPLDGPARSRLGIPDQNAAMHVRLLMAPCDFEIAVRMLRR